MRKSTDDGLRACPTCGTEVKKVQLGLRDYSSWVADFLPGRVGGSDIDFVLEQSRTGRCLFVEFKRRGESLPMGQRLLLRAMVRRGMEVWVAWEDDTHVEVGSLSDHGDVVFLQKMTHRQFGQKVNRWWTVGLED